MNQFNSQNQDNYLSLHYTPEKNDYKIFIMSGKIIEMLANNLKITRNEALIAFAGLMQVGAYLRSVEDTRFVTLATNYGFKKVFKYNLIEASKSVGNLYSFRSIARSRREQISLIGLDYGFEGHLSDSFKKLYAEQLKLVPEEEKPFMYACCTDFQLGSLKTPALSEHFLLMRERDRKKSSVKKVLEINF